MATSFFGHTFRPSSTCKTPGRRAKSDKEMALHQCLLRFQVHHPSADVDLPQSAARIHFPHSRHNVCRFISFGNGAHVRLQLSTSSTKGLASPTSSRHDSRSLDRVGAGTKSRLAEDRWLSTLSVKGVHVAPNIFKSPISSLERYKALTLTRGCPPIWISLRGRGIFGVMDATGFYFYFGIPSLFLMACSILT